MYNQHLTYILRESIKKVLSEDETQDNTIKLYHRVGFRNNSNLGYLGTLRSVLKDGLKVEESNDGDGIGKCIWFSNSFNDYGKKGWFVLSFDYNPKDRFKYEMGFDGRNGYAYKSIPMSELHIEKIPLLTFYYDDGGVRDVFTKEDLLDARFGTPDEQMSKMDHKYGTTGIHLDMWDYFNIPYDKNTITNYPNVIVQNLLPGNY